jgi:TolB protein
MLLAYPMFGFRVSKFAATTAVTSCLIGLSAATTGCLQPLVQGRSANAEPVRKTLSVTGAGTALERLTSEPVSERSPAISSDGTTLLFDVHVYNTSCGDANTKTLVAINPNTRAQRTLYTADTSRSFGPTWFPDGSSYVYASDSPGNQSLVRALTAAPNAAISVIASGEVAPYASGPSMSPDGKRVAFNMVVRDTWNVAVIDTDGSHLTILGEGADPAWSPDGSALAFRRTVGGHNQLFLIDPSSGTDLVQLTSGEFDNHSPAWSPDGQYIAFSTTRGWRKDAGESKRMNLFILKRDGTDLTQLTAGDTFSVDPSWGADNWIYFASDQAGNFDIWRLKPAGKYGELGAPPSRDARPAKGTKPKAGGTLPPPSTPPTAPVGSPSSGACQKDNDCKGDRICEGGVCVSPSK